MGKQVFESGELQPDAMARTMAVLQEYAGEIKQYGVDHVHLIGTEALRQARNNDQFGDLIRRQLGWELKVISGKEEAAYSFSGALDAVDSSNKNIVVMDVGGGSTEIIFGQDQVMGEFVSLPLGVVELAEKFQMKEQLSKQDQVDLRKKIRHQLEKVTFLTKREPEEVLIGVGGTITTIVAIKENLHRYDPEKINGFILDKKEVVEIFESLNRLTLTQRRQIPALVKGREDVILYGTLIYLEMMEYAGFTTIVASDRGLRFGYYKYIEGITGQRDKG